MMANVERRDEYEASLVGRYVPLPKKKGEARAISWMPSWRILRHLRKYNGAAAAAASEARRRSGPLRETGASREEGDADSVDDGSDGAETWDVDDVE